MTRWVAVDEDGLIWWFKTKPYRRKSNYQGNDFWFVETFEKDAFLINEKVMNDIIKKEYHGMMNL